MDTLVDTLVAPLTPEAVASLTATPPAAAAAAPALPAGVPIPPPAFTSVHQIAGCLVPGDVVFDVGANVGNKAAALLERGVHVVCIEPQPACVAVLQRRFAGHPLISIVPKGLGARVGMLELHINSRSPTLSTFSQEWMQGRFKDEVWDQKAEIPITTLDHLVRQFGAPRYLKIDVEGFEYDVISGLSQRVGIVSYEFTSEYLANAQRLLRYLDNLGYRRFNFSLGEHADFAMSRWGDIGETSAMLVEACRRDNLAWGDIYAN